MLEMKSRLSQLYSLVATEGDRLRQKELARPQKNEFCLCVVRTTNPILHLQINK